MSNDNKQFHLSHIETNWGMVQQAHQGPVAERPAAREELLERYAAAVRAYLVKVLRNPDAAGEVFQEFALRIIRGDFHRADPTRGRFRQLVKTTLYHLIVDYRRKENAQPRSLGEHDPEPAVEAADLGGLDDALLANWREELLAHAWRCLEEAEKQGGAPYHTVLRLKTEHPEAKSLELSKLLTTIKKKNYTAVNYRTMLDRARHRVSELVVERVAAQRRSRSREELMDELSDLGLGDYCVQALAAWKPPS